MDTELLIQILLASVPAGFVGLVGVALVNGRARKTLGEIGLLVSCMVCVLVASRLIAGTWPMWPVIRSEQWMPWFACAAAALGVVSVWGERWAGNSLRRLVGMLTTLSVLGVGGMAWLTLRRSLVGGESAAVLQAALAAGVGVFLSVGMALVCRQAGRASSIALAVLACGFGAMLVAGFASLTQGRFVGVVAAFLSGGALVSLWRADLKLGLGLGLASGLFLSAAGIQAWAFGSSAAPWSMALASLAPWTVLALSQRQRRTQPAREGFKVCAIHAIAGAAWIGAAIAVSAALGAHAKSQQPGGPSLSDYE